MVEGALAGVVLGLGLRLGLAGRGLAGSVTESARFQRRAKSKDDATPRKIPRKRGKSVGGEETLPRPARRGEGRGEGVQAPK